MKYETVQNEKNIYTISEGLNGAVLVHAKFHDTEKEPWWEIAVNPIHYSANGSRMNWRVEHSHEEALETITEMTNKLIEGFDNQ